MKTKTVRYLILALGWLLGASVASAQHYNISRSHTSEFYLIAQYWKLETGTLSNVTLPDAPGVNPPMVTGDISYHTDNTFFWGLGFAYNLTDQFTVRAEFTFGNPDYKMTYRNSTLSGTAYVHTGRVNADYNFMKTAVTPFVSAGLGYTYFDTGVPSGPPGYNIWWDYWWGPIVVVSQPTYSDTYFSYNAAAGVRWDPNDRTALRLALSGNWTDYGRVGTLLATELNLSFSWKF
ncbi:MAG TPA: outer membrane beta-barrel protein [Candidatus Didemnitutus sp.]|nr:outer membrane beta-barrel protein [Candidatus Didemnitutus sp.]